MSFPVRFTANSVPSVFCLLSIMTALVNQPVKSNEGKEPDHRRNELGEGSQFEVLAQVTERVWFGSEPVAPESFRELRELGIKYVVSVDGATPKVEAARREGLRYVHIPFGYDGIPEVSALSLARVMREAGGDPVFIHCHHGKHRGPAGAAIACRAADSDFTSEDAVELIRGAGTSPDYDGLWRDVEAFEPPSGFVTWPNLVEVAEMNSLTEAMASMGRAFDHLKLLEKSQWETLESHPDLVSVNEAVLVWEALKESRRLDAGEYPEEYLIWMKKSEKVAHDLVESLRSKDDSEADRHFASLRTSCKQCHREYRD